MRRAAPPHLTWTGPGVSPLVSPSPEFLAALKERAKNSDTRWRGPVISGHDSLAHRRPPHG